MKQKTKKEMPLCRSQNAAMLYYAIAKNHGLPRVGEAEMD